ncbi:MAG: carbamoyltransferase [Patescibacteria group bacterium]|nr:carbamoyltransferase [bacterium]MDZ4240726.1 carbamoyltransferase [Patescibacteria group bacterium]
MRILGISAYYHDSAAALVIDGEVVAAAHEERFTRKKHDAGFPTHAVEYVLSEYGLTISDLNAVVFYDKPLLKFERLLETYHAFAPTGLTSFSMAMPVWIKEKLFMRANIWKGLEEATGKKIHKRPPLLFPEHHLSHAASAFYPSPFKNAAILTVDGVGEWATTTICLGEGKEVSILREMKFPHSIGLLYSAFTYYCGFKVNSGEYKLMGLAPYGAKGSKRVTLFKEKILSELVSLKEDGSITLNMSYFTFATGDRMCNNKKWEALFNIPPRPAESLLTQEHSDLALAIQEVTEEIMVRLARTAKEITGSEYLVLAGGVALNCVVNARIREASIFKDVWAQPAAGDAGGALGAALAGYHIWAGKDRVLRESKDAMNGSYLGPEYSVTDIERTIRKYGAEFEKYDEYEELAKKVADLIAQGNVVGWMQGRMEWGPRALGNRSILADARNPEMQKKLNLKIKQREGFRPFAPSVLEEDVSEYFETKTPSPYMLFTVPVAKKRRKPFPSQDLPLFEKLYTPRSDIPAVTHLDYSARIQTVPKETNEKYWKLINFFKEKTGYGILINTSFNVRGEPIVCTPEDAYRCFMNTEMDYLVIGDFLFDKKKQPEFAQGLFNSSANELD